MTAGDPAEAVDPSLELDTSALPDAVETYLAENRAELVEFAETLVGFDTETPPGRTARAVGWPDATLEGRR